ncbi:hypothetical protein D3C78_827170 [compost metagenome]
MTEKAILEADLVFINSLLQAIKDAEQIRQMTLHTVHPEYPTPSVPALVDELEIKKHGIEWRLRRIDLVGR